MSTASWLEPLYDAEGLLALNKPAGLLVHPTQLDAQETVTLLQRAEAHFGQRLWPLHRLDKGTSGVLLLARDAASAARLAALFRDGLMDKRYLGLVRGWPSLEGGLIDHPLARDPERPSQGQPLLPAQTRWRCLARQTWPVSSRPGFETTRTALLALEPLQGRRHQIRRHCKHMAHPLIGDATHGKGPLNRLLAPLLGSPRLWLHAASLRWPGGPCIEAPPGPDWDQLLPG